MEEVRLGRASVALLPVVRGLPSEAPSVARAIESTAPHLVALSISPDELEALRTYDGRPAEAANFEEEIYMAGLSAWETPVKPAPCFTEAVRTSAARHVPVEPLDMDEETFTSAYTRFVGAVELLFQGRAEGRLARKRFRATTPEEFVLEWDAAVNRSTGFARLQIEREKHMASRIETLAGTSDKILAVVEVERIRGVLGALRA